MVRYTNEQSQRLTREDAMSSVPKPSARAGNRFASAATTSGGKRPLFHPSAKQPAQQPAAQKLVACEIYRRNTAAGIGVGSTQVKHAAFCARHAKVERRANDEGKRSNRKNVLKSPNVLTVHANIPSGSSCSRAAGGAGERHNGQRGMSRRKAASNQRQ